MGTWSLPHIRDIHNESHYSPDYGQAGIQFKEILEIDPHRVDEMDIYSNILYVTEDRLRLSKLARGFSAVDKDRPEVGWLVGVYFVRRIGRRCSVYS